MDDDDLEEMRRLRRSRGYAEDRPIPRPTHSSNSSTFGDSLQAHFGVASAKDPVEKSSASVSPAKFADFQVPAVPLRKPLQDNDGDDIGPSLPPSKRISTDDLDDDIGPSPPPSKSNPVDDDDDDFGPALPANFKRNQSSESVPAGTTSTASTIDNAIIDEFRIPISHQITMKGHTKAVSSMALDRAGSRLISGGYDYMLRLWDFNGMDRRARAFREVEADEGHQVVNLEYSSPSPNRVLVVTASSRPLIYDRDGKRLAEFARGDMYLRDMKNTAGHVSSCVGGQWLPTDSNLFITGSGDGTIRIWDVNKTAKCRDVIKVKAIRGRLPVTSCAASKDGKFISASCRDGSLQIWRNNARFIRPNIHIPNAHEPESSTSRLVFSGDNNQLISRGGDNTIKVWDLRNTKTVLKSFDNLLNIFPETDVILSPDERLIIGCVSAKRGEGKGSLVFIDRANLEIVQTVVVSDGAAIRAIWNESINQIAVGCSDFNVHVLFNPAVSTKGALLCAGKKPKKKDPMDFHRIVVPHVIGESGPSKKRQREKDSLDPKKGRIPELPSKKQGTFPSTHSKYLLSNVVKDDAREEDPREAILRMAEVAEKNPMFFGRAYAETQPVPIFDTSELEDEQESGQDR